MYDALNKSSLFQVLSGGLNNFLSPEDFERMKLLL